MSRVQGPNSVWSNTFRHWAGAEVGMGLLAMAVYAFTLAPGIPAGDSGELIAVAASGGVAHAPGYPLYTLLAHAWIALVPVGSIAWRMNLLSAVCAAIAVFVLVRTVMRLTASRWAAAVAGALLAFSPPLWKNALVAEVFALHALLGAALLAALASALAGSVPAGTTMLDGASARPRRRPLLAIALLTGLVASHHHSLALLALPVAAVTVMWYRRSAAASRRRGPRPSRGVPDSPLPWIAIAAAVALGLAPLAYLPLAAAADPPLSWGDVRGPRDLLRLLARADYGSFRLDPAALGHRGGVNHAVHYLASLPASFGWPGLALLVPGVIALVRLPLLGLAVAGFAILQCLFFSRIHFPLEPPVFRGVVERFHLLPHLVLALVAGLGSGIVLARRAGRTRRLAGAALLLAALLPPLLTHGARVSQRGNRFVERLAADVLAGVPTGGVLFVRGDVLHNAIAALQHAEGARPDVSLVDQELMTYDWYVRSLRRRDPTLLPPLGLADRVVLRDGSAVDGRVLESNRDSLGIRTIGGFRTVPRSEVARIEHPDPVTMFPEVRASYRTSWLVPAVEDRYSGLPGTVNALWIEHLIEDRPMAFVDFKDDSWRRRFEMVRAGHVLLAVRKGSGPSREAQARRALDLLAGCHLEEAFSTHHPWSFEHAERARIAGMVDQSAVQVVRGGGEASLAGHPGFARLRTVIERAEREPTPEPALLHAAAILRLFSPALRDSARAREDLLRWLALAPAGPDAEQARRWLARF